MTKLQPIDQLRDRHLHDLQQLYQTTWWAAERKLPDIQRMLAATSLIVGLEEPDSQRLVAFCRLLSDGVYRAMIYDVVVAQDYRGQGIGQQLVARVMAHPQVRSLEQVGLTCLPEMVPFYQKLGFSLVGDMQLMRWADGSTLQQR